VRILLPPARWVRVACLVAFALVLAQLFLLDEPPLVRELKSFMWDKSLHAMAFGSFSLLLWFGVGYDRPIANWLMIGVVASLDEFHQIFIPTRSADILDVVADMVGAAIVTFILHRLSHPRAENALPASPPIVETGD
jgi:VanZ family protein